GDAGDIDSYNGAVASMLRLNRSAAQLGAGVGVRAGTDITGFGLLGHLWEMASRSGVTVDVWAESVPLLAGARKLSDAGVHTGGEGRNRDWVGGNARIDPGVPADLASLLFDPQTSGGLVLACPRRKATLLETSFAEAGEPLWRIGQVRAGTPAIHVTARP
ncbi:MAG: AIR synthase-related protein, partial [Tepidiformaceae bacterium]